MPRFDDFIATEVLKSLAWQCDKMELKRLVNLLSSYFDCFAKKFLGREGPFYTVRF